MRIALVITELDPGGAEKCLTQLACYLSDHGHAVRVFAIGPPPESGQDQFLQTLETHKIPVAFGIGPGRKRSSRSFPGVVRWLRNELRQFKPEVVQSMLFHGNLLTALAADRIHSQVFGGVRVRQPERIRWWLERWASSRMLKLVCVSEDVRQHCEQFEGIRSDKLVTIPNGIDLQAVTQVASANIEWKWAKFGVPEDARVILFVGRLHPQKGIEELVARSADLLSTFPEHHLVVIGTGPLESRLRELPAARVHILGWQANVLAFMQRAEVLVLPACYEGMPNVLLEAMAVRLPFVAYDIDGVRQLLGDSAFTLNQIAEPGDFDQLVALTHQLILDPQLRADCAASNYNRVESHFQLKDQLAAYADLYGLR
jgi:glycosyltransferase involved in cell wall biosynthesis